MSSHPESSGGAGDPERLDRGRPLPEHEDNDRDDGNDECSSPRGHAGEAKDEEEGERRTNRDCEGRERLSRIDLADVDRNEVEDRIGRDEHVVHRPGHPVPDVHRDTHQRRLPSDIVADNACNGSPSVAVMTLAG